MEQLGGEDIGSVLRSSGPVVKCVLLRAAKACDADAETKPSAESSSGSSGGEAADTNSSDTSINHADWIEQIEVDTTPKKAMVSEILGGPFTFLGQYEEEGVVVMIRRPDAFDEVNEEDEEEEKKSNGTKEASRSPPINPHALQPPLHKKVVRGDILLMRVAPCADEDDDEQDDDDAEDATAAASAAAAAATAKSNDEFFLDYTRDEYLTFAARTDIPEHEVDDGVDEEEQEEEVDEGAEGSDGDDDDDDDDDDDESDEEFGEEDAEDDDDEEDDAGGFFKLLLDSCLRRFTEENGRDPDAQELHEIRKALSEKLGVDLPSLDDGADSDNEGEEQEQQQQHQTSEDGKDAKANEGQSSDAVKGMPVEEDIQSAKSPKPTEEKRGEKRSSSVVSPEDSSGGDSEERARKRANADQGSTEPITCP